MALRNLLDDLRDRMAGPGFHPALVRGHAIHTGAQAQRAIGIAGRLNAEREGRPKQPVILETADHSAVTLPGRWVYVALGFAQRLSDDALAFVLGHEMAHHDLGHLTLRMSMAGRLGWRQQIESQADRAGLRLMHRAGFDPAGALEATDTRRWDDDEPPDRFADWAPALRALLERHRRSHPPLRERHAALTTWIRQLQGSGRRSPGSR